MFLIIDLRDDENKSHRSVQFEFQPQTTITQLKDKICSVFGIAQEDQEIIDKNDHRIDLLIGSLESAGIQEDNETLILKHAELPRWVEYRNCVEDVRKRGNAQKAVQLHQNLMKCGFFDVYLDFEDYRQKHHHEVASYANVKLIEAAVKNHFLIQHGLRGGISISGFRFDWNPRSNSAHKGIIAYVQLHEEEQLTKYLIKRGSFPNTIELFSYKFLELLEVGPAVQFILPSDYTEATYIVSTWRNDFTQLSDISDENELSIKALIQLRLLNVLFFIGDLQEDNCGQWKSTDNAAIVDLILLPYATYPDVKKAVRSPIELAWDDVARKFFLEYPQVEFWNIARKCLDEWNLLDKIKKSDELIVAEKRQLEIELRRKSDYVTVTNELDNHLDAIKANLEKLLNELGSSK